MLPALATAREQARIVSCANNEKQIGLATMNYLNDHQGMFPCTIDVGDGRHRGWDDLIAEYLGLDWPESEKNLAYIRKALYTSEVLSCPSDKVERDNAIWLPKSYAMNKYDETAGGAVAQNLPDLVADFSVGRSAKIARVKDPSSAFLMGEMWAGSNRAGATMVNTTRTLTTGNTIYKLISDFDCNVNDIASYQYCHDERGSANMAFADGHVKFMKAQTLLDGSENPSGLVFWGSWLDHTK